MRCQTSTGNRIERTTVRRLLPLPGFPRRSMTTSAGISGISQSAASEGPPRSPAPEKALRRTGPKRPKSISRSSGSVVFVVCFFTASRLSRADDANCVVFDFRVHDIEQSLSGRIADEDEALAMKLIRVVRPQRVGERRGRLVERDPVLREVR